MAQPRDNGFDDQQSVEISEEAIERALDRILEAEKPYFNPDGTLAQLGVGRESAAS